jgi:hypothetical protein
MNKKANKILKIWFNKMTDEERKEFTAYLLKAGEVFIPNDEDKIKKWMDFVVLANEVQGYIRDGMCEQMGVEGEKEHGNEKSS